MTPEQEMEIMRGMLAEQQIRIKALANMLKRAIDFIEAHEDPAPSALIVSGHQLLKAIGEEEK